MPTARQRRPRLTDEQTARRVIDAALAMLADQGIELGLDHLRFEDVIRAADVSRTSAYRRWPTRDAFVEDVFVELARDSDQADESAAVGALVKAALGALGPAAATRTGQRDLLVEMLRLSLQTDMEGMIASPHFRTNLALRGAFVSVRSAALREEVAAALAAGEGRAAARAGLLLAGGIPVCGQRLVPPLAAPEGFAVLGLSIAVASIGFVVAALADPALLTDTRALAPYGTSRVAEWSVPALALAGMVMAHVEPDPAAALLTPGELVANLAALADTGWGDGTRPGPGVPPVS